MALTKINAPTIAIARAAADELQRRGYESDTLGWHVVSIAGQSLVQIVIDEEKKKIAPDTFAATYAAACKGVQNA